MAVTPPAARHSIIVVGHGAAGAITGRFHGTAPNAVAMLRALVFGRIAGTNAIRAE